MAGSRLIRRHFRSMLVIVGASVVVGAVYEPVTTGVLTVVGPLIGFVLGVPLVLFELLFPLKFMRRWPFTVSVLAKSLFYVFTILLVFLGTTLVYGAVHGLTLSDFVRAVWSPDTVLKVAVGSLAYVAIIFFQQLNRLLGPGTLVRYLFGRYHRPHREERIFMFLDLKDSTAIAERMDMGDYYGLLNDFFHDIADPVIETKAEIYQYVGDEVVLTWPMAAGLRDANCIRVFYEIDAVVKRRASTYLSRYGLVPEYKAGISGGEVIRAEIGDMKRELIYNGDVLNTTSRIQAECNNFDARLLASSALCGRMHLPEGIVAENLGEVILKGRSHPIGLVRLREAEEKPDQARPVADRPA